MGLFLLEGGLRNEHGEVAVLHTQLLNFPVKELFDRLPDGVGPGPQHIAAADIIVLDHLCFGDDLEGNSNVTSDDYDYDHYHLEVENGTCV